MDEGYASVSRAAAQNLAAGGNSGAVNYAVVNPSTRTKNRHPVTDQYAVVDPSKKSKKKKKVMFMIFFLLLPVLFCDRKVWTV